MWLKIKVWTKITLATALMVYALLFIYNNSGKQVDFWWWFGHMPTASVFTLSCLAFLSGAVSAILIRTTWKTYAQVREIQMRSKAQKLVRDVETMKSKAGMLQTKPTTPVSAEALDDDLV